MQPRDLGRTVMLCVIGGSADAIAFLRYDTFVGAMTGNTVLLGIDLAEWRLDRAGFHLGIVAVFLAAVIVTQTALKVRVPPSLPLLLTAVMLGGSEFIAGAWSAIICAAALGMQNAAVRTIAGVTINTVFITCGKRIDAALNCSVLTTRRVDRDSSRSTIFANQPAKGK